MMMTWESSSCTGCNTAETWWRSFGGPPPPFNPDRSVALTSTGLHIKQRVSPAAVQAVRNHDTLFSSLFIAELILEVPDRVVLTWLWFGTCHSLFFLPPTVVFVYPPPLPSFLPSFLFSSNSWDTVSIEYTSLSVEVDEFVYTHQVSRPAGRTAAVGRGKR